MRIKYTRSRGEGAQKLMKVGRSGSAMWGFFRSRNHGIPRTKECQLITFTEGDCYNLYQDWPLFKLWKVIPVWYGYGYGVVWSFCCSVTTDSLENA